MSRNMPKPPNPKHAQGNKILKPALGWQINGVGFTVSERGNVRMHGKRGDVQRVKFMSADEFADMVWDHLCNAE
jgi:hypothetical protein